MISMETVNLYEHFQMDPRGAEGGILKIWRWVTPAAMSPRRRRPVVLILPGGGYEKVSLRESEPVAMRFFARGYQTAVLQYSVAPSRFPVALREAAMAMAYLRTREEHWELGPIAAVGFSAGGHLCGTLGTMFDCPAVLALELPASARPDALGLCYPVAVSWGKTHQGSFSALAGADEALQGRLSLDRLVRPDMPPTYLWHTWEDSTVPVRNSLILANAMAEQGVFFSLHIHPRGKHGLSTGDTQSFARYNLTPFSKGIETWPEDMMAFFEELGFRTEDDLEGKG